MAMSPLSSTLSWTDVAVRLALTVLVGIVIGYDRSTHGKAAGMRTTVLVCLAASVAMIQVNMLLLTAGRPRDSFVMNDLMRLPLGILTGIGFIGGGAILRRGSMVVGVTTAATLWLVTVIGLCIGGGQLVLGLAAAAIGLFALRFLAWVEGGLAQERYARLELRFDMKMIDGNVIRRRLDDMAVTILNTLLVITDTGAQGTIAFEVCLVHRARRPQTPTLVERLAAEPGVTKVDLQELA
jgi:putative Mg2+ transporter-C (MgtC) family protein